MHYKVTSRERLVALIKFDEFIDVKRQHLFTDTHIHIYMDTRVLSRDS